MLWLVENAILMPAFLNKFVISLVSLSVYVNLAHFVFWVSCSLFLFLLTLCKIDISCLLMCKIYFNLSCSFCMLVGSRLYVGIQLTKYLIADSLCSRGWHESLGIMVSVNEGFLYIYQRMAYCHFWW
jgi:hypothetical protein